MPGKIYVQDALMRQEFNDAEGQTVTIVRPDKKVVWIIVPRERVYTELRLKGKLPGQFIQIPPDALSKRLVGKEAVKLLINNLENKGLHTFQTKIIRTELVIKGSTRKKP